MGGSLRAVAVAVTVAVACSRIDSGELGSLQAASEHLHRRLRHSPLALND